MAQKVDFLVIGTGMAGLIYALKVAEHGKVCVLSKTEMEETATSYAQGGIAAVMYSPDSYESHIADTINAGVGLNDEEIRELANQNQIKAVLKEHSIVLEIPLIQ